MASEKELQEEQRNGDSGSLPNIDEEFEDEDEEGNKEFTIDPLDDLNSQTYETDESSHEPDDFCNQSNITDWLYQTMMMKMITLTPIATSIVEMLLMRKVEVVLILIRANLMFTLEWVAGLERKGMH